MKASEVLKRYAEGQRNFRGANLQGQSFKGKDLSGADFTEADIRSADFTNAYLRGTQFVGAVAGLQQRLANELVIVCWLLAGLSGFASVWVGASVTLVLNNAIAGWTASVIIILFAQVAFRKGVLTALAVLMGTLAALGVGTLGATGIVAGTFTGALTDTLAGALAGALAGTGVLSISLAFSGVITIFEDISMGLIVVLCGIEVGALLGFRTGAAAMARVRNESVPISEAVVRGIVRYVNCMPCDGGIKPIVTLIAILTLATLGIYFGLRAMKGDTRDKRISYASIAIAATGGTSFRGADLTNADFTGATLKNTDLRRANLTLVRWKDVVKLDFVRLEETYLNQPEIRQLVITGNGRHKNYDRLNLQGINLQGANLQGASLIEANLNDASLYDADLTNARLVHAQMDRADLTGVTLTGAYIEEWNITTTTKLNGIRCDYIFMRLPPERRPAFIALSPEESHDPNQRRKPEDWHKNFGDGDFADFIAPMQQTLDLYHNQPVDPRLVAIAFQDLRENNIEADLEMVSFERRGGNKDKLLVRAETSPQANHSELSSQYYTNFDYLNSLSPDAKTALLVERGALLLERGSIANTVLQGLLEIKHRIPDIYVDNSSSVDNKQIQGEKNMTGDRTIHSVGRDYHEDNRDMKGSTGNITEKVEGNYIQQGSEQRPDLAEAAAEIQKLLKQLEQNNPTATESQQQAYVDAVVNPSLKARFVNALQAGWKETIKELLDNSYVNVGVAILEGWQEAE